MTEQADKQSIGEIAMEWVRRRSVAIVLGEKEPQQIGTGVVVNLGDRTFIASVAHNFTDIVSSAFRPDELSVMGANDRGMVKLRVREWALAPTSEEFESKSYEPLEDLAWAEVERSVVHDAGLIEVGIPEIGPGISLVDDQLYAAAGFPWSRIESGKSNSLIVNPQGVPFTNQVKTLTLFTHFTNPTDVDLSASGHHVIKSEDKVQAMNSEIVESPPPHGMSGGGLWEVSPNEANGVRNIRYRLVGLIRAHRPGALLAIPIEHWLSFVINANPDLREHLPTQDEK